METARVNYFFIKDDEDGDGDDESLILDIPFNSF